VGNTKEFDNIFNECLEHLLNGQETIEQCLQRYPAYAKELEPLLQTVVLMHQVADVKPSAEFRARARYQMQLKMAQTAVPKRVARTIPRWAIAVCTAMFVFVLGGSTVLAAQNVMPGNLLYAVKLTTENLQVRLAGSEEKKTELYVTMANQRITEMTWLVNHDKTQNLEAAAQRLNNYYKSIGELSMTGSTKTTFSAAVSSGTTMPSSAVATPMTATVTTETYTTVAATTEIQTTLVPTTTPVAIGATGNNSYTTVITAPVTTVVLATIPASSSNQVPGNNNANLTDILISNANTQPGEIQQLLNSDKVPESVKNTLRQALAQSNAAYQSAINNSNR
jgi:hypothetical protein